LDLIRRSWMHDKCTPKVVCPTFGVHVCFQEDGGLLKDMFQF
jgi:hypothetical protein